MKVLDAHGITREDLDRDTLDLRLDDVLENPTMVDGAVFVTGKGHPELERVFSRGFRALSLTEVGRLEGKDFFERELVSDGKGAMITTLQSPVVLIARSGAPDRLVTATLESLYSPTEEAPFDFLLPREAAASFVVSLPTFAVHRAALNYFSHGDGDNHSP